VAKGYTVDEPTTLTYSRDAAKTDVLRKIKPIVTTLLNFESLVIISVLHIIFMIQITLNYIHDSNMTKSINDN
jgi:hypothetical protein